MCFIADNSVFVENRDFARRNQVFLTDSRRIQLSFEHKQYLLALVFSLIDVYLVKNRTTYLNL